MARTLKRVALELCLAGAVVAAVAAAVWTLRLPLLESVATRQLRAAGFPDAVVHLDRFDLTTLSGEVRLTPDQTGPDGPGPGRVTVTYALAELMAGRVQSVTVAGLRLPARLAADGTATLAGLVLRRPATPESDSETKTAAGATAGPIAGLAFDLPLDQAVLSDVGVHLATPAGPVRLLGDATLTPGAEGGFDLGAEIRLAHEEAELALTGALALAADGSGQARLQIVSADSRHPALQVSGLTGQADLTRSDTGALAYRIALTAQGLAVAGLPALHALTVSGNGDEQHQALRVDLTAPDAGASLSGRVAVAPPDHGPTTGANGPPTHALHTEALLRLDSLPDLLAAFLGGASAGLLRGGSGTVRLALDGTVPAGWPWEDAAPLDALDLAGPVTLDLAHLSSPRIEGQAAAAGDLTARLAGGVLTARPPVCLPVQLSPVAASGYRLDRATTWCLHLVTPEGAGAGDGPDSIPALSLVLARGAVSLPDLRLDLTDPPGRWLLTPTEGGRPRLRLDGVQDGRVGVAWRPDLSPSEITFGLRADRFALPESGLSGRSLAAQGRWRPAGAPVLTVSLRSQNLRTGAAPAPVVPLAVALEIAGDPAATLRFSGSATGAPGVPRAELTGRQDVPTGRGEVTLRLDPLTFGQGGPAAETLFPLLAGRVREVSGRVEGRLDYRWGGAQTEGRAQVLLEDLALTSDFGRLEGVNGPIHLRSLTPPATEGWQTLGIGLFNPGLPLTNGVARFRLTEDGRLAVNRLTWDWAQGTLRAFPFEVAWQHPQGRFEVLARDLALPEILALTPFEGLSATGRLDGQLPVVLSGDSLRVADGRLSTTAAGRIHYAGGGDPAALRRSLTTFDLDTLRAVFSDFHYDQLSLGLDGEVGGEMLAKIRVSGANPGFQGGHPVRLNLNLSGKLVSILQQSLRVYRIPEQVRQRMMEYRQQQRQE